VEDNAKLIYGSVDFTMGGNLANGFWVEPMVLEGIKYDSPSYHQEFFGPIFTLYKVKD
jgi:acyl-CoA reductase-like NAD-dependent aldehyde dehydrogenase